MVTKGYFFKFDNVFFFESSLERKIDIMILLNSIKQRKSKHKSGKVDLEVYCFISRVRVVSIFQNLDKVERSRVVMQFFCLIDVNGRDEIWSQKPIFE